MRGTNKARLLRHERKGIIKKNITKKREKRWKEKGNMELYESKKNNVQACWGKKER